MHMCIGSPTRRSRRRGCARIACSAASAQRVRSCGDLRTRTRTRGCGSWPPRSSMERSRRTTASGRRSHPTLATTRTCTRRWRAGCSTGWTTSTSRTSSPTPSTSAVVPATCAACSKAEAWNACLSLTPQAPLPCAATLRHARSTHAPRTLPHTAPCRLARRPLSLSLFTLSAPHSVELCAPALHRRASTSSTSSSSSSSSSFTLSLGPNLLLLLHPVPRSQPAMQAPVHVTGCNHLRRVCRCDARPQCDRCSGAEPSGVRGDAAAATRPETSSRNLKPNPNPKPQAKSLNPKPQAETSTRTRTRTSTRSRSRCRSPTPKQVTQVQLREGEEFPKLPKESADLIVSCMHMHWVSTNLAFILVPSLHTRSPACTCTGSVLYLAFILGLP